MSQFFQIHPENPQSRLIAQAVAIIRNGGVIVYPTDSCYAMGCHIGNKGAADRIRRIRRLAPDHDFSLMCSDLTEVGIYTKLDNPAYRLLKGLTPGPYTFILKTTKEVPRRLLAPKRKTLGVRIANNQIVIDLLAALGEPMISTTLHLPNEEYPMTDPYDIRDTLSSQVDLVIDGGYCGVETTTVVDMTDDVPNVLRAGLGDTSVFEE